MQTVLDAPFDSLDPAEQTFVGAIREHGWFRTNVPGDDEGPGFSYSTGFWSSVRRPELIVFGLKSEIAHDLMWDLYRTFPHFDPSSGNVRTDEVFSNLPAYLFPVAQRYYAEYLGWSRWFYGSDDFPCLQIVWPDRAGRFPWEAGFEQAFLGDQIDLTESGWRKE